ncbi:GyrI-like domain-containing protein [Lujinxingia litoralis]|nr:GyrI-like domain-containing protein [Lujinxingia litoralis]
MLDAKEIISTRAKPSAVIRMTIAREMMPELFGPALEEIFDQLRTQGVISSGPAYAYHLRMDPEVFDFEAGVTVASPVTPAGRVEAGELPAHSQVARATYTGPYEGLGPAWGEFDGWVKEEGHTPEESLWEVYISGPESSTDPSTWRTDLYRPLKDS